MVTDNIWNNFKFIEEQTTSALDLLNDFKEGLVSQTGGELEIDIEAVDTYIKSNPIELAAAYKFFIVAPKLGNFRRKILTVIEYSNKGRFPVDIVNHYSNDDERSCDIKEADFKKKIEEILSSPIVKNSIENLYKQSKAYNREK